jgi:hypothetical protein
MFFSGATDEEGRLEESGAALTSATMSSGTITPGLLIKICPARIVGVLGPTAHPGLPLEVFLGVGRCRRL